MKHADVKLWHTYYARDFQHARPKPKHKIVIPVADNATDFLLFLVNTKVHDFIENKHHLKVCQAPILVSDHSFLEHDSHADCIEAYRSLADELEDDKYSGPLTLTCVDRILYAVKACTVLKMNHKLPIIKSAEDFLKTNSP